LPERPRSELGLLAVMAIAVCVLVAPHNVFSGDKSPTVFAAASLKNALDAVASDWQVENGQSVVISYAATSALAKQIEQGAEADIFISADQAWMDYVAKQGLIDQGSRFDMVGNRLVLIASKGSDLKVSLKPGVPFAAWLGDGRLAIANVRSVPAGKYAKAALESLGVWDEVKGRLAQGENVRAALRLVSRGEVALGIVYASDAKADPNVKVLARFSEDSHPPIIYPAAEIAGSLSSEANDFLQYLRSPEASRRFAENGFTVLLSQ
jgi:molybdate transport system substrate-binding protein